MHLVTGLCQSSVLYWRNRFVGKEEKCPCCDAEVETLEHFLLNCPAYQEIRNNSKLFEEEENIENVARLGNLLLFGKLNKESIITRKMFLKDIWKKRQRKLRENN